MDVFSKHAPDTLYAFARSTIYTPTRSYVIILPETQKKWCFVCVMEPTNIPDHVIPASAGLGPVSRV